MNPITFVTWKWKTAGYRSAFTADYVNRMAQMIARNYDAPHRVVCVTNESEGIDPAITVVPDRADFADVPSPHGGRNPSCYRRLLMFAPDAADVFGERFVSIDLDAVITGDLRPLVDREDDFIGWQDRLWPNQYCGSLIGLRAGSRPQVWQRFDPRRSPQEALAAGYRGSDQAWVSYCLPGEPQWTRDDGVYSFRFDLDEGRRPLPENARVVMFHGRFDPWGFEAQSLEWVRRHWQ